jgi:hypothetical protein
MLVVGCSEALQPAQSVSPGIDNEDAQISKAETLLYVSDIPTATVHVYTYPAGVAVDNIHGFEEPNGICADRSGHVFVTDGETAAVREFEHGNNRPIATLRDSGEAPTDCAFDPTTGNLAVTSSAGSGGPPAYGSGNIAIYEHEKGPPKRFLDPDLHSGYNCAYDDRGNLFVSGSNWSLGFAYAELPMNSKRFRNLKLNAKVSGIGGLQWDGHEMALSVPRALAVYRADGNKLLGVTTFRSLQGIYQFAIARGAIVIPQGAGNTAEIGIWRYPIGGSPIKVIRGNLAQPWGIAISPPSGTSVPQRVKDSN